MQKAMKNVLEKIVPQSWHRYYRRLSSFISAQKNKDKSAQQIFSHIYAKNLWGGKAGQFHSGPGSQGLFVSEFCQLVNDFIALQKKDSLRVIDLGCGDFTIGSNIANPGIKYTGIDVVPGLIAQNQKAFGSASIQFICQDMATQPLPDGDVCIIKQVLQHLSNSQIISILEKTKKYQYVFVAESYPVKLTQANKDKVQGADTRLVEGSAVDLQKPPFNIANVTLVLDTTWGRDERIKTFLIKNT